MTDVACSTCPQTDMDEIAIICSFVCVCDIKPLKGKGGANLKQLCVSKGLDWMRKEKVGLTILPEVGYYMKPNPPVPLMGKKDVDGLPEPIKNHWHRFNKVKGLLKEEGETYSNGMLRIPDVIITHNPDLPPTQDNIKQVVEIKFPGDTWGKGQKEAYEEIAGPNALLTPMTTSSCGCNTDNEETEPSRNTVPSIEAAWSKERDRQDISKLAEVGIIIGTALLTVVLVLDDALPTGVTQANDVFIPGVVLKLGHSATRLWTAFAGSVAVPALIP